MVVMTPSEAGRAKKTTLLRLSRTVAAMYPSEERRM
jgi:hypothetical protein